VRARLYHRVFGCLPRQSGLLLASSGGGGGGSGFTVPTTPATSTATKAPLNPNFTAGPTGLDPYRPWCTAQLAGNIFVVDGWDTNRRWDPTLGTSWATIGTVAPATFALALSAAGTPAAIPNGQTARYYVVFYNPTTGEETAPQAGAELTLANASGALRDMTITWTAAEAPTGFTKARAYRALYGTDTFLKAIEADTSAATMLDVSNDAAITATNVLYVSTWRTTLSPTAVGIQVSGNRIFLWDRSFEGLYYGGLYDATAAFRCTDFKSTWIVPIGSGKGAPRAMHPYYGSDIVWLRAAIFEKDGVDPATWSVRELSSQRGAINQRCVLPLDGRFLVLDDNGIYEWTPGGVPQVAGVAPGMRASPMQPYFDRMNLAAAETFHIQHIQEEKLAIFWVALDFEPIPNTGFVFDYGAGRFIGPYDARWSCAAGRLADAVGTLHPIRGCDMGYGWEDEYAQSEGVFAGTNAVAATAGSGLTIAASTASFDTTVAAGAPGTPMDRYNSVGAVVDENRVYSATGTVLTGYYYPVTAYATGDQIGIGVIPGIFETSYIDFQTPWQVWVRNVIIDFENGPAGNLRLDTALDAADFTYRQEQALNATNANDSSGIVWSILPVSNANRGRLFAVRFSQRYANLGFSFSGIHIHSDDLPERRS
jgi:hypothetical protein